MLALLGDLLASWRRFYDHQQTAFKAKTTNLKTRGDLKRGASPAVLFGQQSEPNLRQNYI